MKTSQASLEFVVIAVFILGAFIVFLMAVESQSSDKIIEQQNQNAVQVAQGVQEEILIAKDASDGYSRTFNIQDKIGSQDYTIQIQGNSIYLNTSDNKIALSLEIPPIIGQLQKGDNLIRKQNETIYIN